MKILITGFDPFGGEDLNPATQAVALVQAPKGVELSKMLNLPPVFGVGEQVIAAIREENPDVVLCVGQAGGRKAVTPERIAINFRDATIPDNKGFCPKEEPVVPGGPAAYFSGLPVKAMAEAMQEAGIPAAVSNSAGTFVCNELLYTLLSYIEERGLPIKAGFIHVPFLPSQVVKRPEMPSMPLETMVKALETALSVIAR